MSMRLLPTDDIDPGRGLWALVRTDFRRKAVYALVTSLVALAVANLMVLLLMGVDFWRSALLPVTVIPPLIAIPICFRAHHRRLVITMLNERLRFALSHDHLTRLSTRQVLMDAFPDVRPPTAIAMIDADHFKSVNDTHGHLAGDEVLRGIATAMMAHVRAGDIVSRFGGEEFAILLRDSDLEEAVAVCQRLKDHIEATPIQTAGGPVAITVSIGVAAVRQGERIENALNRADMAVYRAKSDGRNRVSVDHGEPLPALAKAPLAIARQA